MQKYVNLVDLVKSFVTSIYLQKSASIQPRTSLSKFPTTCKRMYMCYNLETRIYVQSAREACATAAAGFSHTSNGKVKSRLKQADVQFPPLQRIDVDGKPDFPTVGCEAGDKVGFTHNLPTTQF